MPPYSDVIDAFNARIPGTLSRDHGHEVGALAKAAVNRLAFGMASELRQHNIAVVALAPGFVGIERVRAAFAGAGRVPGNLESPEYIGRAVVALAADPNVMARSGRVLTVGHLAPEYGFTDVDGR